MLARSPSNSQYVSFQNRDSRHFTGLFGLFATWHARWAERRSFAQELWLMSDETLKDFGLTRSEARKRSSLPFWRA